ncbi:hypothetical protein BHM03_00029864 [Ensete ventricosum]|nr:hypothetical protein BHM03_00029864 [Ensete ventricosum]
MNMHPMNSGLIRKAELQECWRTMQKERNTRSIVSEGLFGTETLKSCQQSTVSLRVRANKKHFRAEQLSMMVKHSLISSWGSI